MDIPNSKIVPQHCNTVNTIYRNSNFFLTLLGYIGNHWQNIYEHTRASLYCLYMTHNHQYTHPHEINCIVLYDLDDEKGEEGGIISDMI